MGLETLIALGLKIIRINRNDIKPGHAWAEFSDIWLTITNS